MAGPVKYNTKEKLKEADKIYKGKPELFGKSCMTFPYYINAMRAVMLTAHLDQFLCQDNVTPPRIYTSAENVVGKHSSGYTKVKSDVEVYKKVVKFEEITDTPFVYNLFLYDPKKDKYSVVTREDSVDLVEHFGFEYNNDVIDSYEEGDKIEKGTVLRKSKSYDHYMNYGYGTDAKIIFNMNPYNTEDACTVRREFAEKNKSISIVTIPAGINSNDFLLNLYGDDENYKGFPDIGEYANGEVLVKRTLFKNQVLSNFNDESMKTILDSDICYYRDGQVVDITIYCNNPDIENNPCNAQIKRYLKAQNRYYKEIKETCERIIQSGSKFTSKIDYLYKRSKEFLDKDSKWKLKGSIFGNIMIYITVKDRVGLNVGQKITGRFGNKSVISKILDDDEMPYYYDDNGEKVIIDIELPELSIVNRTIAFALIEPHINFIVDKFICKMKVADTLEEKVNLLLEVMEPFNKEDAKKFKKYCSTASREELEEAINYVIDNKKAHIHIDNLDESEYIFETIRKMHEKYDFLTPYQIYVNEHGRTDVPCLNTAYVSDAYILKLKQDSIKGFSARSSGAVNSKNLPERSYNNKAFTELRSSTNVRFGEFESLNELIAVDPLDFQIFQLLYRTSVKGRRDLYRQLLTDEDYIGVNKSYTSVVAELLYALNKYLGIGIEFIDKEDIQLKEYDDKKLKTFELDGNEYICTEYDFLLIKRRKEIEDEVMEEKGIIDAEDFEKTVMDILKSRKYIVGPPKEDYDKSFALTTSNY